MGAQYYKNIMSTGFDSKLINHLLYGTTVIYFKVSVSSDTALVPIRLKDCGYPGPTQRHGASGCTTPDSSKVIRTLCLTGCIKVAEILHSAYNTARKRFRLTSAARGLGKVYLRACHAILGSSTTDSAILVIS